MYAQLCMYEYKGKPRLTISNAKTKKILININE